MKQQSKTAKIRALLEAGKGVAEIAKKLRVAPASVYQVRYRMRKESVPDPVNSPVKHSVGMRRSAPKADEALVSPRAMASLVAAVMEQEKIDMVNSPPHYTEGGIETIDFIESKYLPYHLGNVVKYVSRAPFKGRFLEDLKKAQWYLNRAIANEEKRNG